MNVEGVFHYTHHILCRPDILRNFMKMDWEICHIASKDYFLIYDGYNQYFWINIYNLKGSIK